MVRVRIKRIEKGSGWELLAAVAVTLASLTASTHDAAMTILWDHVSEMQ